MTRTHAIASHHGRYGVILLTVCWSVLILTLLLLYQVHSVEMRRSMQRSANIDLQLRMALASVENQVLAAMEADGESAANEWDAPSESWGWNKINKQFEQAMQAAYPDIQITGSIEDEDSKVPLKSMNSEAVAKLFQSLGRAEMESERITEAIAKSLNEAAGAKNTDDAANSGNGDKFPFPDLRFLLDVSNFDSNFVLGEDMNFNQALDSNEDDGPETKPVDNRDGVLQQGLGRYFTIYGDGKVNPNFASIEVLQTVPGVSKAIAEEIVWKRNGTDGIAGTDDDYVYQKIENLKELRSLSKLGELEYRKMSPKMRVTSKTFSLRLCATSLRAGQRHRIQMVIKRGKEQTNVLSCVEDYGS
ncbi:MAG: hypothetical protein ABFD69_10455 [Candidatus Sumerlaeia bacterium]